MTIGNAGRDFLIHLILLPILEFLQTSPRIIGATRTKEAKQRGVSISMSVLIAVSAIKIGCELTMDKEPSYYDMMEVYPSAVQVDIKKGFKQASLKVHPDKQQPTGDDDGASDEAFLALKAAYDVLSDTAQRDLYDKFGKAGLDAKDDTTTLLAGLGFFYVISVMMAYMLTRRKTVDRAQTWALTGLLALGIFEYQACILSFDFLQEYLPQLAMFEKIELLHRLYPPYLLGARMIAWLFYEDHDAHNFVMLQGLHWKVDQLSKRMEMMAEAKGASTSQATPLSLPPLTGEERPTPLHWEQLGRANLDAMIAEGEKAQAAWRNNTQGGAAGATEGADGGGAAAGAPSSAEAGGAEQQQPPGGVGPPMPASIGVAAPSGAPAAPAKQESGGGGRSLGSLVWFFGVYFFFQWLLGRGQ